MTALATNKDTQYKEGAMLSFPVEDNVHIYKGALVCTNGAGYLTPGAATSGNVLAGVAFEECDNTLTGHTQGGKTCRVLRHGVVLVGATSITQAMLGEMMYIVDDQTVDETAVTEINAGILVEYVSATAGWIDIEPAISASDEVTFVTVTDDRTVLASESGTVFALATTGKTFTLPATANGLKFTFVNTGADAAVLLNIDPDAADKIIGNDLIGNDGGILSNTAATAKSGDTVSIVGDGGVGWWIVSSLGVWAIA